MRKAFSGCACWITRNLPRPGLSVLLVSYRPLAWLLLIEVLVAQSRAGGSVAPSAVLRVAFIIDFHTNAQNCPSDDCKLQPYRPGHPYYKYSSMGGSSCGIKERSGLDAVLSEWSDIYGASPPADSRLLAHYRTTPPEAPPIKLRRKAENDAGSAFKRWALRRGKEE